MTKPVGSYSYLRSFNQIVKKHPRASAMGAIFTAACLGIYCMILQFPFRAIKASQITMIDRIHSKAYFIFKNFFIGLNPKEIGFLLNTLSKENENIITPLKLGSRTYEVSAYEPQGDQNAPLIKVTCVNENKTFEGAIGKGSILAKSVFKAEPKASRFTISYPEIDKCRIATFIFRIEILHRHQQLEKISDANLRKEMISIFVEIAKSGYSYPSLDTLNYFSDPKKLRNFLKISG